MKLRYAAAVSISIYAAGAMAVELNTDAMKKMQQEGHKILEEEKGQRTFALPNGNCLQAAGGNVASAKCNDKAANQKWRLDDTGRLVSHDGAKCASVAGDGKKPGSNAVLQKCSGDARQKWKLDGAKRLTNQKGLCLQANGNNVVAAKCSKAATQKWG